MRTGGIPILTYHSMRIHGNAYADNDLVALAADLETIKAAGKRVEPLARIVDALLARDEHFFRQHIVGLSCDDGPDFDFHDLDHPQAGRQRSVLNVLKDYAARHGPRPHITSFVIVSPEAREELDRACMIGRGWWNDGWWQDAVASGHMHIGNHSWDHNHDALPASFGDWPRGSFRVVDHEAFADHQIARASTFLHMRGPNPGAALFAYPYGESNAYLQEDYLPRRAETLGLRAAFGTTAAAVEIGSPRWDLPRFVCGRDWTSPGGLREILGA